MKDKSNGELFAEAVREALAPEDAPRAEPETPTRPRKPAPVPEIGSIGAPGHREAQKMYDFEQAMTAAMNRYR